MITQCIILKNINIEIRISNNVYTINRIYSYALMHAFFLDEEINKGQPKNFPELQKFMEDEK